MGLWDRDWYVDEHLRRQGFKVPPRRPASRPKPNPETVPRRPEAADTEPTPDDIDARQRRWRVQQQAARHADQRARLQALIQRERAQQPIDPAINTAAVIWIVILVAFLVVLALRKLLHHFAPI